MQRSRVRKLKKAGKPAPTLSAHVLLKRAPIAAAVFAAIPPLYAAEESGELEQVVVTAEKRTENLQDVPISITALDTKSLEQLHIEDFNDYVKYLPSVSFQASSAGGGASGPGFTRIFMRGVSSGDNGNHSGPLPTVGVYLDEQPITTIQGPVDLHVYDVERIEALAGPQGTLYGASSLAGTVRIITNKPDPSAFKAGYDLELMTTKGQPGFIAEGFVNIPLSPSAAIRIVGWSEHDGGYINNVAGTFTYASSGNLCIGNNPPPAGCLPTLVSPKNNFNSLDLYGARMALKVNLNDNWTITPTLMGQEDRTGGMFAYDPLVGNFDTTRFYPDTIKDKWYQIGLTVQGKLGNLELTYAGAFLHRNDYTAADYADYTLYYDKVYGSGVCYFQGANQNGNVCNAAGPFFNPTQYILASDGYMKNSQELRIATPKESSVRFVGGVYYERQQHDIQQDYVIDDLPTYNSVTGWAQTHWLTLQERVDRDAAIFGELSWDIVRSLTLTVGDRLFKYDNSLTGFFGFGLHNVFNSATGEQSCFLGPIVAGTPCTDLANSVSATSNIPKLNLTYRIGDDALVYATYSKGYRPGGINRRTQAPPLPPLATYAPDYLQNYEAGFKTSWFHNHLRFNGALFWDNWDNFQFSFLGPNSFTLVRNATGAAARIKGVELQLDWLPVQGLAINAGVTGLQAVMANDFCVTTDSNGVPLPLTGPNACQLQNAVPAGTLLPSVPKWKGDLTIRYSWPMGDYTGHVQLSGDYVTQETQALPPAWATLLGNTPAYGLVDFSGGIDHSNFFANLVVSNLFNKEAQYYRYSECPTYSPFITGTPTTLGAPLCGQRPHVGVATPITVGVQFGQRF